MTVHGDPATLWARLLRRTVRNPETGCWVFTGSVTSRGYGSVGSGVRGGSVTTHRLAVIVRDGSIPDGMTVDHQCHDSSTCRLTTECPHRRCVNPDHLAVMGQADNTRRQWESNTCRQGHPLTLRKDGTRRQCVTCRRAYSAQLRAAARAAA